jgi:hypothetical protein
VSPSSCFFPFASNWLAYCQLTAMQLVGTQGEDYIHNLNSQDVTRKRKRKIAHKKSAQHADLSLVAPLRGPVVSPHRGSAIALPGLFEHTTSGRMEIQANWSMNRGGFIEAVPSPKWRRSRQGRNRKRNKKGVPVRTAPLPEGDAANRMFTPKCQPCAFATQFQPSPGIDLSRVFDSVRTASQVGFNSPLSFECC